MAENKKSFIAYADWKETFDKLPDEIAGKLIKHIFAYVNDENPVSDDYVIDAIFSNIKNTLKRDLKKWETQLDQRREAGKRSAEQRALNKSNERSISLNETQRNSTVSVSDSVSDSVSEIKKQNNKALPFKFFDSLICLGAEKQLASDWIAVRKLKKLSNTITAFESFNNEVKKSGKNINEILKECVINSWGGFKSEWLKNKQQLTEKKYTSPTSQNRPVS